VGKRYREKEAELDSLFQNCFVVVTGQMDSKTTGEAMSFGILNACENLLNLDLNSVTL
jgi:hypothetical protein